MRVGGLGAQLMVLLRFIVTERHETPTPELEENRTKVKHEKERWLG